MKLAVLIDGENVSASLAPELFRQIATLGSAPIRRIYGDFSVPSMKPWGPPIALHGLIAVQQFANVSGKNAADIALVIDAMDILRDDTVNGFCLVSSDSDFTRLAARLREGGRRVFGFGDLRTSPAFINVCHQHFRLEVAKSSLTPSGKAERVAPVAKPPQTLKAAIPAGQPKAPAAQPAKSFVKLAIRAMSELAHEDGWLPLSAVGSRLKAVDPDFACRSFGKSNLTSLFKACDAFEVETHTDGTKRVRVRSASALAQ